MSLNQILFLFHLIYSVNCARIMFLQFIPMYSHSEVQSALATALSLRGHKVVLATSFPLKNSSLTNLTEIDLSYLKDVGQLGFEMKNNPLPFLLLPKIYEHTHSVYLKMLEDERLKKTFKNEHFDLLVIECTGISSYAIGYLLNVPVICMLPFTASYNAYDSVGNVNYPVHYADVVFPYYSRSIIWQKIVRLFNFALFKSFYYFYILPRYDAIMRRYIEDENMPYLGDLERNVSLMFLNVNPIMDEIRANVPAIIELQLLHLKPLNPLPNKLQQILDDSPEGVIYISFGTGVRLSNEPKVVEAINKTVSKLPYTVLWKIEDSLSLHITGKNVFAQEWFPQQDLLAHPNLKLFITHGGRQSVEEAIVHRVPMIIIPFFADQFIHAHRIAENGIAIHLNLGEITETLFNSSIEDVLTNPLYKKRVIEASKQLLDQPTSGVEKAVWWTEYVLRHKGASHLRSPFLGVPFYEFLMLDFLFYILIAVVFCWLCKRLLTARFTVKNGMEKQKKAKTP